MKILFLHQNFPGQFKHLAGHLAADSSNQVVFVTRRAGSSLPGVAKVEYRPAREPAAETHHYLVSVEDGVLHGQAVAKVALALRKRGFVPDIICAHPGWGEALYVKDVFPDAPLLNYCEWYYRAFGGDAHHDPTLPARLDDVCRIRTRNALHLLNLEACNQGIAPTHWQKQQFPADFHGRISVVHDGVDTAVAKPNPRARVRLADGRERNRGHEVLTYVARNLEPYRGFPSFMRALPEILAARPNCQVLVVGGDEVSYGQRLPAGETYRQRMLAEVNIDRDRVHFLGRIPYEQYLNVLQVSSAHLYLTVPFVLSWSMMEAMATGCVVVGADTPPAAEVIEHGRNGFLVDLYSPEAIAAQTIDVLSHRNDYADVANAARQTIVDRYDLHRLCLPRQLRLVSELAGADRQVGQSLSVAGLKPPTSLSRLEPVRR